MELQQELYYAKQGLALSETGDCSPLRSFTICLLQHFSQKPWVVIDLEESECLNYIAEWDHLTSTLTKSPLDFLSTLRKLEATNLDLQSIMPAFKDYFNTKEFRIKSAIFTNGKEKTTKIFATSTNKTKTEKIKMMCEEDGTFRLITPIRLLFPQPMSFAEELIDQLIRFKILEQIFSQNKIKIDLKSDPMHIQIFETLNGYIDALSKVTSFADIFLIIAPTIQQSEHFILKNLIQVEREISLMEQVELRVNLINAITSEMFYPVRCAVLEEKEKFEIAAIESKERLLRLQADTEKLHNEITCSEKEVKALEAKVSKNAATAKDSVKKLKELKQKVEEVKEVEAFYSFVTSLSKFSFENSGKILSALHQLNMDKFKKYSLSKMADKTQNIFFMKYPPTLQARLAKNADSDRTLLVDILTQLSQQPRVKQESNEVLSIRGSHVILSTCLSEIRVAVQKSSMIEEIRFFIQGNFVMDEDMEKETFSGKRIAIVSDNIIVGDRSLVIDVSGKDGVANPVGKNANGANAGGSGNNGLHGNAGGNGGCVHVEALNNILNVDNLKIHCNGGNGAKGQDGGDGRKGEDGKNGKDATPSVEPSWWGSYTDSFSVISCGVSGTSGKAGGLGGNGGLGGEGGKGGTSQIISQNHASKVQFQPGTRAPDGKDGLDAPNGKNGYNGKDHGWGKGGLWCNSVETWGYSLVAKEISNWTFTGYEISEGSEPATMKILQNVRTSVTQNQRKTSGHMKTFDKADISELRESIVAGLANDSGTLQQSIVKDLRSINQAATELSRKSQAQEMQFQRTKAENDTKLKHMQMLQSKVSKNDAHAAEAQKFELEAIHAAAMYEQLDLELESAQEAAKQKTTQMQYESMVTTQTVQTTLKGVEPEDAEITECRQTVAAKPTGRFCLIQSETDDDYAFYTELSAGVPEKRQKALEACFQTVFITLGKIPGQYRKTLQNFYNQVDVVYLKEKLASDLILCQKFEDNPHVVKRIPKLFDFVLICRTGTMQDFDWEQMHGIPEDLRNSNMFTELIEEDVMRKVTRETRLSKDSMLNKLKDKFTKAEVPSETEQELEIKKTILQKARELYTEIKSAMQDDFHYTLEKFLRDIISCISDIKKVDESIDKFVEKLDNFNKNWILKTIQEDRENSYKYIPFILQKLKLNISDLQSVKEAANDKLDSDGICLTLNTVHNLREIVNTVLGIFIKNHSQTYIEQFHKLTKSEDVQILTKFVRLVESKNLDLELKTRIEKYKECSKCSNSEERESYLIDFYVQETKGVAGSRTTDEKSNFIDGFIGHLERLINEKKLNKNGIRTFVCVILENGRIHGAKLVDFDFLELKDVENSLWNNLKSANFDICMEIQQIIDDKVTLDTDSIISKYNIHICQEKSEQIWKHLLKFLSHASGSDESNITDTNRMKKYVKFSLSRIEYCLAYTGECLEIHRLLEQIYGMKNTDPVKIRQVLDSFYEAACGQDKDLSFAEYLTFLINNEDFTTESGQNFYKLFVSMLRYVKFKKQELYDEKELGTLKQKILEHSVYTSSEKKLLIATLNSTIGEDDFPSQLLSAEIRTLSAQSRQLVRLLEATQANLNSLRSQDGNTIFVLAKFASSVQDEILTKINLSNLVEMETKAKALIGEVILITDEDRTRGIAKYKLDCILRGQKFPFVDELWLILNVYGLNVVETVNLLENIKTKWTDLLKKEVGKKGCWELLVTAVKDHVGTTTSDFSCNLVKLLLNITYEQSTRTFLIRFLQKLQQCPAAIKLARDVKWLNKDDNLTQDHLYKTLMPQFNPQHLQSLFLLPEETQYINVLLDESSSQGCCLHTQLEEIFSNKPPSAWIHLLQKMLYEVYLERLCSLTTDLSQEADFVSTMKLTRLTQRQRKKLRILQQVNLRAAFKSAFFLTPSSHRFQWLMIIADIYKSIRSSSVAIFSSSRDVVNFFKFSTDLSITAFQTIIRSRLSFNWLQSILTSYFETFVERLPKDFVDELALKEIQDSISTFTATPSQARLDFLIILRQHLISEQKRGGDGLNVNPQEISRILDGIAGAKIGSAALNELKPFFVNSPLSYWPRLIRRQKLKIQFSAFSESNVISKLMGMDGKFGEQIVDRFTAIKMVRGLGEQDLGQLVNKFGCSEWILDSGALRILGSQFWYFDLDENAKPIKTKSAALFGEHEIGTTFKLPSGEWMLDKESLIALRSGNTCSLGQLITAYTVKKREKELDLSALITEAKDHPLNNDADLLSVIQRNILMVYEALDSTYFVTNDKELDKHKVNSWIESIKDRDLHWSHDLQQQDVIAVLAIVYRAMEIHAFKPRNSQLVSILLLISGRFPHQPNSNAEGGGKMGEIETGEGKSCIIAMFAAFCALFNASIHVITSNKVLALDDEEEYRPFYDLFGFSVSNNCDGKSADDKKYERYNSTVVYGEIGAFQADHLNTVFHQKDIIRKEADVVVVDEVDSLLLDKASNMLYLSHEIPELRHLRSVFLIIWQVVQGRAKHCTKNKASSRQYSESDINVVKQSVQKRLETDRELRFPSCLANFINIRLGVWIKQAFRAHFMPVNESFIVSEADTKVVNMDNSTGVEEKNMHLQLGLQQFLQLRFTAKLSPESLKCVYISNHKYLNGYRKKLYGITGTLGGSDERDLLSSKYNITYFGMPKFTPNKRLEKAALMAVDDGTWLQNIKNSVVNHPKQPVLIITENIARLNQIMGFLREQTDITARFMDKGVTGLHEYKSSEKDTEFTKTVKKKEGLTAKDLVGSTNLGGRGTDFKISKDAVDGLHVILSYLPSNLRVQKQAFGRAARAGESGSVQFVISVSPEPNGSVPDCLEEILEVRNMKEIQRLGQVKRDSLKLDLEDELFEGYTRFLNEEIRKSRNFMRYKKRIRKLQLDFLNNRWSIWLDSLRGQLDRLHLQVQVGRKSILRKFDSFKQAQLAKLNSEDVKCFAEFPSELTKLGLCYEEVASKSVLNSLTKTEFADAGEILEENWESVKNFGSNVVDAVKNPLKSISVVAVAAEEFGQNVLLNAVDIISSPVDSLGKLGSVVVHPITTTKNLYSAGEDYCNSGFNLNIDLGLSILGTAIINEAKITDAATAYSGTLSIQRNSTNIKVAKVFLQKAKIKLLEAMEHNMSCCHLLERAIESGGKLNELNGKVNRFKEQMYSEVNLLQCHVDSITAALQSPITPSFFKTQLRNVESDEESAELYEILQDLDLLKSYRFSRKVDGKRDELMSTLTATKLPCYLDNLLDFIYEKLEADDRDVTQDELNDLVLTKEDFCELLFEHNLIEVPGSDEGEPAYVITIDSQKYANFQKNAETKLPSILSIHESSIKILLYKNLGQDYDEDKLFKAPDPKLAENDSNNNYLQLTETERKQLKSELISLDWITRTCPPVKVAVKNVIDLLNINTGEIKVPDEIQAQQKTIQGLFMANGTVRKEFPLSHIPFPGTKEEGSKIIFQVLISNNIVKEPCLKFKKNFDYGKIQAKIKGIEAKIEGKLQGSKVKETFLTTEANTEDDFKKYMKEICEVVIKSIGTLKRHPKIRVNYHLLTTRVTMLENKYSDELNDFMREGLFHRVFSFDEDIRWYENPATLVLLLGVLEIAAGVALEIVSLGALSPLANFLISEGGTDMYYSIKQLYQGERLDSSHYLQYKLENMALSAATCWIPGGGAAGSALASMTGKQLLKQVGKAMLREIIKQGGKALIVSFIEENTDKGIVNTLMRVRTAMDKLMKSVAFEIQIQQLQTNSQTLRSASFDHDQAEDFLKKLFSSVGSIGKNSFQMKLQQSLTRVVNRLVIWFMKDFVKHTMPISNVQMIGLFGASGKSLQNSSNEIQVFIVSTLEKFNTEILAKSVRLSAIKKKTLHGDNKSSEAEFNAFMEIALEKLKTDIKEAICSFIYEQLCSPPVRKRVQESVASGYRKITLNGTRLGATDIEDEDFESMHAETEPESLKDQVISNADGRTRGEVAELIGEDKFEFLTDNLDRDYVNIIDEASISYGFFTPSNTTGLDDYINWRNENYA